MKPEESAAWNVNESLLQSYRSVMALSQSVLLTAAGVFYDRSRLLCLVTGLAGLVQLWYVWVPVIRSRAVITDFHKFCTLYRFAERVNAQGGERTSGEPPLTEELYVKHRDIRARANATLARLTGIEKLKSNLRPTRRKLDRVLPASFTLIWCMLLTMLALGWNG